MMGYARNGLTTTATGRLNLTDQHIAGINESSNTVWYKGTGAIISGGFTVTWPSGFTCPAAVNFMSLCLAGGAYQVGEWSKSTSLTPPTAVDTITTTDMTPIAVLLASDCYPASTSVVVGHRLALGGAAAGTNVGLVVTDKSAATTTAAYKYNNSYNALLIADDDTETTQAYGYAGSFTSGSFEFVWTNNSTSAATQICYVAFGH
jgi:hypothetical protein